MPSGCRNSASPKTPQEVPLPVELLDAVRAVGHVEVPLRVKGNPRRIEEFSRFTPLFPKGEKERSVRPKDHHLVTTAVYHIHPPLRITGHPLGVIEHFLSEESAKRVREGADGDALQNLSGFGATSLQEKPQAEFWCFQKNHGGFFPHGFSPVEGGGNAADGDGFFGEGGSAPLQFLDRTGGIFPAKNRQDIGVPEDLFSFRGFSLPEGADETSQIGGISPKNPEPPFRKLHGEVSDGVGLPLRSFSENTGGNADN